MITQLTLYGHKASPYAEKIELALKEADIAHKYYAVSLPDKPAFFVEKVYSVGKVPAITYGGPDVPPEEPSANSIKVGESNVILEFIADAYPEAQLMPTQIVQRAQVRYFIETVTNRYLPAYLAWIFDREPEAADKLLAEIEFLQGLLAENGEYAVGAKYTIADACITPFIHRLYLSINNDIGKYPTGDGPKLGESLSDPKYAKFVAYAKAMTGRPVSKEVYIEEDVKGTWIRLFGRSEDSGRKTITLSWIPRFIKTFLGAC